MAKLQILDINGNKIGEMTSDIFDGQIRLDIIQKIVETEKERQLYAPFLWAGMNSSASGNVKHNRHVWKTDRGKGMGRFPKKRMSDKGDRFVWVGAIIPGVRGGRRAHPPKLLRADLKINKKEQIFGMLSALALISSQEEIKKKYARLNGAGFKFNLPLVVDEKMLKLKSKEFFGALNKILGDDAFEIAVQKKAVRAGKGKMRGRTYKKNAGILFIVGNNQDIKISGIDTIKARDLKMIDIAANGARLALFTEQAIKDLESRIKGKNEKAEIKPKASKK